MKNLFAILALVWILAIAASAQTYRVYPVNFDAVTIVEVPAGSELIAFRPFALEGRSFPGAMFAVTGSEILEPVILWHGRKEIQAPRMIGDRNRRRVECAYVSYYLDPADLSIVYAGTGCGYVYQ